MRRRRDDRGQATMELVILAPFIVLVAVFALAAGRWSEASSVAENAAQTAAESAAISNGGPGASLAATDAAAGVFASHGLACEANSLVVRVHSGPVGLWTATVSCQTSMAQVLFHGLPHIPFTFTATSSAPVVPYRSSGSNSP